MSEPGTWSYGPIASPIVVPVVYDDRVIHYPWDSIERFVTFTEGEWFGKFRIDMKDGTHRWASCALNEGLLTRLAMWGVR